MQVLNAGAKVQVLNAILPKKKKKNMVKLFSFVCVPWDLNLNAVKIIYEIENLKTEYDKCKEKELLQDMLEVVEKREQLITDMEDTKKRLEN